MFISNMYNEVSGRTSNCQWLETVEQLNLMNIKTIKKTRLHGTKKEALTDLRSAGSFKKSKQKQQGRSENTLRSDSVISQMIWKRHW